MYNIVISSIYKQHTENNYLFDNLNAEIGEDLFAPFHQLKKAGLSHNINFETYDRLINKNIDGFIFIDMPDISDSIFQKALTLNKPRYLIVFESILTRWQNYAPENFKYFNKIFTYNDDYIKSHKNFIKINYSIYPPDIKEIEFPSSDSNLCVMIASNKKSNHFGELYSERLKIINWFELNKPSDFDLYGGDWNLYTFNNTFPIKYLNRLKFIRRWLYRPLSVYKGRVVKKTNVFKNYKFSICFENACDVNGYITEKIFDSMKAGCIPVYLGAPNISNYIPSSCFVDARNFHNVEDLYTHLKFMTENDRLRHYNSILNFFNSKKAYNFYVENFSTTILNSISEELHL